MSIKALKKAVKKSKDAKDNFVTGTVVAWTSADTYEYAAIKAGTRWFTTAASYNTFVKQILTFEELLEVLGRSETSNVRISDTWKSIG